MGLGVGIAGLLLSAGTAAVSHRQTKKTEERAEATTKRAEDVAQEAADKAQADIIASEQEAAEAKKKRAAELASGGRAAQFQTGPLGVTSAATVGKKTLLGG